MGHSVAQHLAVSAATYDVEIRRFIPGYDDMLDEAASALAEHVAPTAHVIDLGAGTGSLSERIAARLDSVRLTLLDIDPAMLAQAVQRLESIRARIALCEGSFTAPLPACDAAAAASSLHHVHDAGDKLALYRNIYSAIAPGGMFVTADAMLPDAGPVAERLRRRWAAHLVASGDTEAQAYARFAEWAKEDRYQPVDAEVAAIKAAGFTTVDVRWRLGPMAVVVAIR
jgi:tRNA (cmo5U34)-methyltransferase